MYKQYGMDLLKRRLLGCDLREGDNAPSMKTRWNAHTEFCSNIIYKKLQIWPMNPLSVTYVNSEILTSDRLKHSPTKTKDLSYTSQNHLEKCSKNSTVGLHPVFGCVNDTDYLQDWDVVDKPNSTKIRNDVNLLLNSEDTCKDNSTMESHSILRVSEMEKLTKNYKTDSGPSDIDWKSEVDIHKDIDVESFHVISHSDVPVNFAEEHTMSRFLNICRNAWNSLTSQLYCKRKSRMSVNHPSYLTKPRYRRKANTIAMGRGRGRAKCQLRRSGVSQTVCRKEYIKPEDYEAWQNALIGTAPNDHLLNSKFDDLNNIKIPDHTQITNHINNLSIFSASKATYMKEKPKMRRKKRENRTKAKYVTKVRYIAKSSRMDNREVADEQEDSSYSDTSSEYDVEDDWIVFEDDDEKTPEIREKRGATEYPIRARYVPSSSMRKKDSSYEDFNSEIQDERMECPRMHHRSMISDKHCKDFDNQMQKDLSQHRRLLSESSETSDDSIFNFDNCNSSFTTEENDDIHDKISFHDEDSHDDSIIFADENSEELTMQIFDNSNISDSDNCNSSFATEENDDVDRYSKMNFYDGDSQDDSIIFADENSEKLTAQTKKVNFDPTPVVHVMVTWNYAYRAARRGPWEQIARDNERFRGRINSFFAIVLNPILNSTHRSQVWQERFAFSE